MKVTGVIMARAGSMGLANKHLLSLLGRPVIEYTFEHARTARSLSRVVVSTDCPGVRRLAIKAKLEVIGRPAELATASASVQDVMLHAMEMTEANGSWRGEAFVVLYGNVPVRPEGVIDRAVEMLAATGCDSVRSFCPVGKWHPAWMSRMDGDRVQALAAGSIHRRQDLEPVYLHDGAVVAVSRKALLRGRATPDDPHAFFGVDRRGVKTESGGAVEIDTVRDLYLAEAELWQAKTGLAKVA